MNPDPDFFLLFFSSICREWLHEYYPAASLLEINEIIFRDYLNPLIEKKVKSHYR
jgi:hypothetical protein